MHRQTIKKLIKPNEIYCMYLVVDRMQVLNHLQRDQKTLEFKGEMKTAEKEKMQKQQSAKRRERRRARLKRRVRTNSGVISMFEVGASSMVELVSTKKKNKVLDFAKLEYYKEVLDFHNIEYHITFLIAQISGQQCHASDSPKNSSSLNSSTKKVIDC